MPTFRYLDEDDSPAGIVLSAAAGAIAGFAVGVLVAQRLGGIDGLTARLRRRTHEIGASVRRRFEEEEEQFVEDDDYAADAELEERVLEAFSNDPVLAERGIDIGSIGDAVIELAGWVNTEDESEHAMTIARGVPGVDTVVNRLAIGEAEAELADTARRFEEGDPALNEAHWHGQQVGTGKRRQGRSNEPDRHADPRPELEERWLSEEEAIRNAAGDTAGIAERRSRSKKTQRSVPKGDHVPGADDSTATGQEGAEARG
ncbi:MAG: BON domain-containing protein [Gemmatimonadaceae bacterium]